MRRSVVKNGFSLFCSSPCQLAISVENPQRRPLRSFADTQSTSARSEVTSVIAAEVADPVAGVRAPAGGEIGGDE